MSAPAFAADLTNLTKEEAGELRYRARMAKAARIRLAREDICEFIRYVLRSEESGESFDLTPDQEAWQALCDSWPRVIIWSHPDGGKTWNIPIARSLFDLGRNPRLRIVIGSETLQLAQKIVVAIREQIESNTRLHEVFPNLKPGKWWTDRAIKVAGATGVKDPSVQAVGVEKGKILGSRIDRLYLDDFVSEDNSRSAEARQYIYDRYKRKFANRLSRRASVVILANAIHPEDAAHRLAKEPAWRSLVCPVANDNGESRWPARFPAERLSAILLELGSLEYTRQYLCKAYDDNTARFKKAWMDAAKARGEGLTLVENLAAIGGLPPGCWVTTGIDLAISKSASSDDTVFFTALFYPNGDKRVLRIKSGKMSGPEILEEVKAVHAAFGGGLQVVETVQAQDYIRQFVVAATDIPIRPFKTGTGEMHPEFIVTALSVEFENGKWIVPAHAGEGPQEVEQWISEMIHYNPKGHLGDRLAASCFCREGGRAVGGDGRPKVAMRVFGGKKKG